MIHPFSQFSAISTNKLNDDIHKISNWIYQWKVHFNLEKYKQVQKVIFSRETQRVNPPAVIFNNVPVLCIYCQKYLNVYFHGKLNFTNHIKAKILKVNQDVGILRKLYNVIPRN